ncbi:MAG TPA: ABC transporter ATP-binding protein [Chloroflexota bacterium]|nr:ABC transporter ATP-binding protein [Chloroflexota bacterium]
MSSTTAPPGYRQLLVTYLGPLWPQVALLGLLLLAATGLALAQPQVLRQFIDSAVAGAPLDTLAWVALIIIGVALALQVAQVVEVYVAENVGLSATNRLRVDLALHVLRLDPPFHAAHPPGVLIERTDGDVATLNTFFSRLVLYLIGHSLLIVGVLALLVQVDWRIGAVAATCTALGVIVMERMHGVVVPKNAAWRQASADLFGTIEERLAGTEDVRANGAVPYVVRRLLERSRNLLWRQTVAHIASWGTFQIASLLMHLGTVLALGIAAYLFMAGELTIGTVYLVFAYSESLRRPVEGITRHVQEFQRAAASTGRIRDLLAERSTIVDGPGAMLPTGAPSVELDRVTFGYGDSEPILRDVSLRLEAGQVLGLLGRTGAGKTTIARLLFRLYDPQVGSVRLGGIDLRQPTLEQLRARVGIVSQDVQLFHASVRDNVTLFDATVPDDRITAVLLDLGLGPWLDRLPNGLDSELAPGGGGLSAGESQLLAFARAFLKDPGLIVLDEASSRLDPATERLLECAVDRLLRGRTAIVIAHRLRTVQRADRIAILEDGQLVEAGDRVALASVPDSRFGRLLRIGLEDAGVLA